MVTCSICQNSKNQAHYGVKGGNATHCKGCKDDANDPALITVTHKKCQGDVNCHENPYYGIVEGDPLFCVKCKENQPNRNELHNVTKPKCECGTFAKYGVKNGKKSILTHCSPCAKVYNTDLDNNLELNDEQKDVLRLKELGHTNCLICDETRPSFALVGTTKEIYCQKCSDKVEAPTYSTKTRCYTCKNKFTKPNTEFDITTLNKDEISQIGLARWGFNGDKKYCGKCKKEGMTDKKDKVNNATNENNTSENKNNCSICFEKCKKYETFCLRCYINQYTNVDNQPHKLSNFQEVVCFQTKKASVGEFIREKFPNCNWEFNKFISNKTSGKRADIYLELGFRAIIIEIDEYPHCVKYEEAYRKGLQELFSNTVHKQVVFIRFNPDKYTDSNGKKIRACWTSGKSVANRIINDNVIINIVKRGN